jgi:hypothetical protein
LNEGRPTSRHDLMVRFEIANLLSEMETQGLCKPTLNQGSTYLPRVRLRCCRPRRSFFAKRKPRLHPPSVSVASLPGQRKGHLVCPGRPVGKGYGDGRAFGCPRESRLVYISRRTSGFSRPRRCRKTGCVSILAVSESMSSTSKSRSETGRNAPASHAKPSQSPCSSLRSVAVGGVRRGVSGRVSRGRHSA